MLLTDSSDDDSSYDIVPILKKETRTNRNRQNSNQQRRRRGINRNQTEPNLLTLQNASESNQNEGKNQENSSELQLNDQNLREKESVSVIRNEIQEHQHQRRRRRANGQSENKIGKSYSNAELKLRVDPQFITSMDSGQDLAVFLVSDSDTSTNDKNQQKGRERNSEKQENESENGNENKKRKDHENREEEPEKAHSESSNYEEPPPKRIRFRFDTENDQSITEKNEFSSNEDLRRKSQNSDIMLSARRNSYLNEEEDQEEYHHHRKKTKKTKRISRREFLERELSKKTILYRVNREKVFGLKSRYTFKLFMKDDCIFTSRTVGLTSDRILIVRGDECRLDLPQYEYEIDIEGWGEKIFRLYKDKTFSADGNTQPAPKSSKQDDDDHIYVASIDINPGTLTQPRKIFLNFEDIQPPDYPDLLYSREPRYSPEKDTYQLDFLGKFVLRSVKNAILDGSGIKRAVTIRKTTPEDLEIEILHEMDPAIVLLIGAASFLV